MINCDEPKCKLAAAYQMRNELTAPKYVNAFSNACVLHVGSVVDAQPHAVTDVGPSPLWSIYPLVQ